MLLIKRNNGALQNITCCHWEVIKMISASWGQWRDSGSSSYLPRQTWWMIMRCVMCTGLTTYVSPPVSPKVFTLKASPGLENVCIFCSRRFSACLLINSHLSDDLWDRTINSSSPVAASTDACWLWRYCKSKGLSKDKKQLIICQKSLYLQYNSFFHSYSNVRTKLHKTESFIN